MLGLLVFTCIFLCYIIVLIEQKKEKEIARLKEKLQRANEQVLRLTMEIANNEQDTKEQGQDTSIV